jgi:DNA polymerase-1
MILQSADGELVLRCPQVELHETASLVRREMESAFKLDVPLLTDARFGKNWGEMEPISL